MNTATADTICSAWCLRLSDAAALLQGRLGTLATLLAAPQVMRDDLMAALLALDLGELAKTAELARPQRVLQRVELGGTGLRYPPPAAPKKKAGKKK